MNSTTLQTTADLTDDATYAAVFGQPDSFDAASGTFLDADAPVVICDTHTARDIDPFSGRCWECGEQVPGLVRK